MSPEFQFVLVTRRDLVGPSLQCWIPGDEEGKTSYGSLKGSTQTQTLFHVCWKTLVKSMKLIKAKFLHGACLLCARSSSKQLLDMSTQPSTQLYQVATNGILLKVEQPDRGKSPDLQHLPTSLSMYPTVQMASYQCYAVHLGVGGDTCHMSLGRCPSHVIATVRTQESRTASGAQITVKWTESIRNP